MKPNTMDKLMRQLVPTPAGCLIWNGYRQATGYGRVSVGGRPEMAHRYFYQQRHGELPPDIWLVHRCHNKLCCNPDHMEAMPRAQALRRARLEYAERAPKPTCRHGHLMEGENVGYRERGRGAKPSRLCRECLRRIRRKSNQTQKERRARLQALGDGEGAGADMGQVCEACGDRSAPLRRGKCHTCYMYERTFGKPRSPEIIALYRQRHAGRDDPGNGNGHHDVAHSTVVLSWVGSGDGGDGQDGLPAQAAKQERRGK